MIDIDSFLRGGVARKAESKPEQRITRTESSRDLKENPSKAPKSTKSGLHVEILMTGHNRRSLSAIIGRVFEVLDVSRTVKDTRYLIELHPGNRIWLPSESVRPFHIQTNDIQAWNDTTTWR
jgi:hypothetical protein